MTQVTDIHIPTQPIIFPPAKRDTPISPKENMLRAINHEKPVWMPYFGACVQHAPMAAFGDLPDRYGGFDWFGVEHKYSEAQGSPTPVKGIMNDVTEWREKVKWPDLDKWDWMKGSEGYERDVSVALYAQYGCGLFEHLHGFESFEQALIDLITEPEECRALFDKLADFRIEVFNRLNDIYHYDFIVYNDDWGTMKGPFFSTELFEKTLLEPTVKVISAIRAKGVKVDFHNCGKMEAFVPYLADDIKADALQIQPINDIGRIIDEYGDRVTAEYRNPDPYLLYDPETTPGQARTLARQVVDEYGAHVRKGAGVIVTANALKEEVFYAFDEEIYTYSLEKYKIVQKAE